MARSSATGAQLAQQHTAPMFAAYSRLNATHPLATKSAVSGSLHGLADLLCQQFDGSSDVRRTFGMTSWGLLAGPVGHKFYVALDKFIRFRGASAIAGKIAVDQFVFTPPLTVCFFAYQSLVAKGSSASDALNLAQRETWPTLLYNWSFWGIAHVITFTSIPLEHRVAWIALKSLLWNGFLSWRLSRLQKAEPPPTHTAALLRRYSTEHSRD